MLSNIGKNWEKEGRKCRFGQVFVKFHVHFYELRPIPLACVRMSMYNPDVKFIDATLWDSQDWVNTGGTRAKRVLLSPENEQYYFKCSEKKAAKEGKPEKYYKYEFWSEVIAYQLGRAAGLNILRYDVATHGGEIGCLSPQMNLADEERLIEVGRFMTALNPDFFPEDNKTRNEYTFELIEKTIEHFNLETYWPTFLQTIVFDALIGNTDRHQENWAFLGRNTLISSGIEEIEREIKSKLDGKINWFLEWFFRLYYDKKRNALHSEAAVMKLTNTDIFSMAPIYDSGSSMGRELTEDRVRFLLSDSHAFDNYLEKGPSEIHWEKKKISHFQFLENLARSSNCGGLLEAGDFLKQLDENLLRSVVWDCDEQVPEAWSSYRIPEDRKKLIVKILTSRLARVKQIIDDCRI